MRWIASVLLVVVMTVSASLSQAAEKATRIAVSYPGPYSLTYLPIDLIPKIGADRAEGAEVRLVPASGGGVAMDNMLNRNADFIVVGLLAGLSARQAGSPLSVIAAVSDRPVFVLVVRSSLRDSVRSVADLRGRAIGVLTSSLSTKTASQQLVELVLTSAGVSLGDVRIVAAGQGWKENSAILETGGVDAIMAFEPVASRLRAEGKVFPLLNLADPADAATISGSNFLHATLMTRPDVVESSPETVATMVRVLRRTLEWMASHSPEEMLAALDIKDAEERKHLLTAMKEYSRLYSRDGVLKPEQLKDTAFLFANANGVDIEKARRLLDSIVVSKWTAGK
ncbi:MAG: ABC transporter substrate-binding protein [Alphaproteobacteria bacterium]